MDGLGFQVEYQDAQMAVIARDEAFLVQSPEYVAKDRPGLGIDTGDVDGLFRELSARAPQLLHPNPNTVQLKPCGAREYAVLDKTTVCVNFRQWPDPL